MPSKQRTSSADQRNTYLRPEKWADGTLAFYLRPGYNFDKYREFHEEQVKRAAALNRI